MSANSDELEARIHTAIAKLANDRLNPPRQDTAYTDYRFIMHLCYLLSSESLMSKHVANELKQDAEDCYMTKNEKRLNEIYQEYRS